MSRLTLLFAMISAQLGMALAASAETTMVVRDATPATGQALPEAIVHSRLAADVLNALKEDPIVELSGLDIRTDDGVVTLTGSQSLLLASDRATYVAETVPGVRRVVNRLSVRQAREADTQRLESDVRYALLTDPATAGNSIDVSADASGRVTLEGVVAGHVERQLAEEVVRSIIGVTAVANRIRIARSHRPSDRQLVAEARQALAWDAYVDGRRIDVAAMDGVVMLAGKVDSAAARRRSIALSWVAGAKNVNASQLKVVDRRIEEVSEDSLGKFELVSDEQLAAIIRRALQADPRLRDSTVEVAVQHAEVTLSGAVDSLLAKRVALGLTHAVRGVGSVDSQLQVPATAQLFSDAEIEARIDRALERNSATRDAVIGISVLDGAVTLEGEASNWLARQIADTVAASIRGVHAVENDIVVANGRGALPFNPYLDMGPFAWVVP
jgi:hyperosmotically inducible protein